MDVDGRHGGQVGDSSDHTSGSVDSSRRGRARARARRVAKRVFDVVVSCIVLVLTMPILLVAAVAIRLDSPGQAICRQIRIGKDGVPFELFQLRSTVVDNEEVRSRLARLDEDSGTSFDVACGRRLTRVGRFLCWASIDELPQYWNVLRGEMSLIGPRPARRSEAESVSPDVLPRRLDVLPGVTGTWRESDSSKAS